MMDAMRQRDTYTDYMSRWEMTAILRKCGSIEQELHGRILALAQRSGAAGVGSGRIRRLPQGREGLLLKVEFASSAWTGLRRKPRHPMVYLIWLFQGLRKLVCPHRLSLVDQSCVFCGISAEWLCDHSWKHLPRHVPWNGKIY